jgi:hypothetical protein
MKKRTNLRKVYFNKMSFSSKSYLFLFKSGLVLVWFSAFGPFFFFFFF